MGLAVARSGEGWFARSLLGDRGIRLAYDYAGTQETLEYKASEWQSLCSVMKNSRAVTADSNRTPQQSRSQAHTKLLLLGVLWLPPPKVRCHFGAAHLLHPGPSSLPLRGAVSWHPDDHGKQHSAAA